MPSRSVPLPLADMPLAAGGAAAGAAAGAPPKAPPSRSTSLGWWALCGGCGGAYAPRLAPLPG